MPVDFGNPWARKPPEPTPPKPPPAREEAPPKRPPGRPPNPVAPPVPIPQAPTPAPAPAPSTVIPHAAVNTHRHGGPTGGRAPTLPEQGPERVRPGKVSVPPAKPHHAAVGQKTTRTGLRVARATSIPVELAAICDEYCAANACTYNGLVVAALAHAVGWTLPPPKRSGPIPKDRPGGDD